MMKRISIFKIEYRLGPSASVLEILVAAEDIGEAYIKAGNLLKLGEPGRKMISLVDTREMVYVEDLKGYLRREFENILELDMDLRVALEARLQQIKDGQV